MGSKLPELYLHQKARITDFFCFGFGPKYSGKCPLLKFSIIFSF
jgi:hypothetical protein